MGTQMTIMIYSSDSANPFQLSPMHTSPSSLNFGEQNKHASNKPYDRTLDTDTVTVSGTDTSADLSSAIPSCDSHSTFTQLPET